MTPRRTPFAILPLAIAALLLGAAPLPAAPQRKSAPTAKRAGKSRPAAVTLSFSGIDCASCAMPLTRRLLRVRGVQGVKIDPAKKRGTVKYDASACKPADLLAAVKDAGFPATVVK